MSPRPDQPATDANPLADARDGEGALASGPQTWSQWFSANASSILFVAVAMGMVLYYLNIVDVIKVAIGLGLVIFIHELGHFLTAKWCDVHVETFSIGFGKAIPGCQFKYGETTYKIGWIPLGGFVKMVGEGENADTEEAEEDPRSFKNKRVGQRMLIISAGVIMNIILAWVCFIIVYSHGVDEPPPIIGWVEAGSPAWQEGLHSEAIIEEIDNLKKPVFDDIRPIVMGTSKGETVRFVVRDGLGGEPHTIVVEPGKDSEALVPTIGVGPAPQLTLASSRKPENKPYQIGSPADLAHAFQGGDRIIGCTDPKDPNNVTPLPADLRDGAAGKQDYFVFQKRLHDLRGHKMIIRVQRGDQTVDIPVEPAFFYTTGMRMAMGRVVAVRKNSPAANAVPETAGEEAGIQPGKAGAKESTGDKITEVEVSLGDKEKRRWSAGKDREDTLEVKGAKWEAQLDPLNPADSLRNALAGIAKADVKVEVLPLDPLRLPFDLEKWAEETNGKLSKPTVRITVLRPTARKEDKAENKYVTLKLDWDESAKYFQETVSAANAPISIPCLGLAYYVDAVVEAVADPSPAKAAGIEIGDLIKEYRQKYFTSGKEEKWTKWVEIKPYQWASVFMGLQRSETKEMELKIERGGKIVEVKLKAEEDTSWPMEDRGFFFQFDTRMHKADGLVDAFGMGVHRTFRFVRVIYQNLYAMVFGRVSPLTMSGPLKIADVSYRIAGENMWQFILFIGMINVNLAVINFLPIPVLDGGHMVFLIYEKIRGKPAPESVLAAAMYTGLALILALMCFVLFLDVKRLFF